MTCKEWQNLLFSARTDDLDSDERESLTKHLADCDDCRSVFQKISKADQILDHIKDATPRIRNEHVLRESILTAIRSDKSALASAGTKPFLDRLSDIFSIEGVRFACGFVLLLIGMMYVFMEYNDTQAIVSLEQRMGKKSEWNRAIIFQQEIDVFNFLRNLYNLSTGNSSSMELTNKLILMKKADLQELLKGYKLLDEASQARLNNLWEKYRKDESLVIGPQGNREELSALRNEIERLKKELEQNNLLKGRP